MTEPQSTKGSLQRRMALIFLLMLGLIVVVTIWVVREATLEHSTVQLKAHIKTSTNVVTDKINNVATVLHEGLKTLAKDFSIKTLISGAKKDKESLYSAMENYQNRLQADIFWVLDDKNKPLISSIESDDIDVNFTSILAQKGVHWYQQNGIFYMMQAVPVKFVETSIHINAWVVMGVVAEALFDEELINLTDMQISMYHYRSSSVIASTFDGNKQSNLASAKIDVSGGIQKVTLDKESYIYQTSILGDWLNSPVYVLLATNESGAYLSNKSLITQLVKVLLMAAVLALFAAILMSRGITRPLQDLIKVAKDISNGKYADHFPTSNTREVETLSTAISDMQHGIVEREKEINHLAFFDELTGLPNRIQFSQHIEKQIADEPDKKVVVLTMDIDRFKEINDTVSHEIGDQLLILIAERLATYAGGKPFFARLGGDEFGIVFSGCDGHEVDSIAGNIVRLFDQPFIINELVLDIDCSVGIAVFPDNADSHQGLLQCADIAMYSCKEQHYRYAKYHPELNKHSVMRLSLMSELRGALHEGQLQLHYQPKLSIGENSISTVECLIRWIHPEHGFVPPDEFIPLAEQTGAIRDVTHWALNVACQQLHVWKEKGMQFGMAVNISVMDLVDMKLPSYIAELLTRYNLKPDMLTLEVTESAVMRDPQNALKSLNTLQTMGIVLSIDDFGTGYSSMAQLKKMPVNELKIDKAFVLDLASSNDDKVMVKTLVSLAQNLSLQTVAEGVEDLATLEFLREIGCTKAQGFYLSKALPAEQFEDWYKNYNETLE